MILGPRIRIHYWSCSKFADWIRGSKKPFAATLEEWDEWNNQQQKERPWRYWASENLLQKIQDIVHYPSDIYSAIYYYVVNRWIDQCHIIKTGLKPGGYYEIDYKILHGLFTTLVDFVEIELADRMNWIENKKYKFKNGRCVEAGRDYLEWASKLTADYYDKDDPKYGQLTTQAINFVEIKKLYEWWKNTRPNRVDPSTIYDGISEKDFMKPNKERYDRYFQMEEQYNREDEQMMIKLIQIRQCLYT